MKNKLLKKVNMALIGLTAISFAQTAIAETETMDLDGYDDFMKSCVKMDVKTLQEDDNAQILTANGHLYMSKQHLSSGSDKAFEGALKVCSSVMNTGHFVTNVAYNINCVTDTINSAEKTYTVGIGAGFGVLVGLEDMQSFKKKTCGHASDAYSSAKAFVENVPKTATFGVNAVTDLGYGIYSLGQATYSLGMGAYHMGHAGVQASQTGFGYFSNWWNGK